MAKKTQNTKSPQNACEKLKNAVYFSPFRRLHRVSNHQQNHTASTPPSNNPIKASKPSTVQLIPINTAEQSGGQTIRPKVDKAQAMFIAKQKRSHDDRNNGGVQVNNERRFSEYITRVRHDMRTSSDLGIERIPTKKISRRDSINDRVASFLIRTKVKIRATSNIGYDMHGKGKDYN